MRSGPSFAEIGCHGLRLEQNLAGVLSVRFLAGGDKEPFAQEQVLFAGLLPEGQEPMTCQTDGHCEPQWPTHLSVATVRRTSFNGRGLVTSLPSARLALGKCELQRRTVRCRAESVEGDVWEAEAKL
jgi:hypothetical protein